jgi:N-acetylglucosamine malate deacetylase 2
MAEGNATADLGWAARTHALLRRLASGDRAQMRVMVLVAHPADESLGAAGLLSRLVDPWVVCLTDGAPRDRRFVPKGLPAAPGPYSKRRRKELRAALALAGVGADRLLQLDVPDQEAALSLPRLVLRLATLARGLRPHLLVTHGYEGGHPDHDAAALAARLAVERLQREEGAAPALAELLSYHREGDRLVADRFLPASTDRWTVLLRLTPRERRLRRAMLECHASQNATMTQLPDRAWERLRPAPSYDFLQPPHERPLQYEVLGFTMDFPRWRELAQQAMHDDRLSDAARSAS